MAAKHVGPRSGSRYKKRDTVGKSDSGPECLAESRWQSVPHKGQQRLRLIDSLTD